MTDIRFLYVTTKDVEQARSIAETLLERRLIACANIIPQMESIYRWQDKIEHSTEAILILKTQKNLVDQAQKAVLELHSYEVPCILTIPIESGAQGYLDWLQAEGKNAGDR